MEEARRIQIQSRNEIIKQVFPFLVKLTKPEHNETLMIYMYSKKFALALNDKHGSIKISPDLTADEIHKVYCYLEDNNFRYEFAPGVKELITNLPIAPID